MCHGLRVMLVGNYFVTVTSLPEDDQTEFIRMLEKDVEYGVCTCHGMGCVGCLRQANRKLLERLHTAKGAYSNEK